MDIIPLIREAALRRRLDIVSISMTWPGEIRPSRITIHWGAGDDALAPASDITTPDGVVALGWTAPEPDIIALGRRSWQDCEQAALHAAWAMGAWDLTRRHYEDGLHWSFRPAQLGVPRHHSDTSLRTNGTRALREPDIVLPHPIWPGQPCGVDLRMGRAPVLVEEPIIARLGRGGHHPNRPKGTRSAISDRKMALVRAIRDRTGCAIPTDPDALDAYIDQHRHVLGPRRATTTTSGPRSRIGPEAPKEAVGETPLRYVTVSVAGRQISKGEYLAPGDPRIDFAPDDYPGGIVAHMASGTLCRAGRWAGHVVCFATIDTSRSDK